MCLILADLLHASAQYDIIANFWGPANGSAARGAPVDTLVPEQPGFPAMIRAVFPETFLAFMPILRICPAGQRTRVVLFEE